MNNSSPGRRREHLGIAQAIQPMRRRVRKTHENRPAGGGGHARFRRLAQNFGAIGVGQNEPRILWHDFDGHGLGIAKKSLSQLAR
jgi:hypothetical protein